MIDLKAIDFNHGISFSTSPKVGIPYKEKLKELSHGFKEGVAGSTTRVKDFCHDAGAKATELKNNITDALKPEIDYIHQDVVQTFLGIPYRYYGGVLLLCYAAHHDLKYNMQMVAGVVFVVALASHFIRWNMRSYKITRGSEEKNLRFIN